MGSQFTIAEHAQWLKSFQDCAKINFDRDWVLYPCVLAITADGTLNIVMIEIPNGRAKDQTAAIMQDFALKGAKCVAFVSEAWTARVSPENSSLREATRKISNEWAGRLHKHPNRREVVMICYATPKGDAMSMADIVRPERQPPYLAEFQTPLFTENVGRFANAFAKAAASVSPLN